MSHNDESHTIWIIRIMPFCAFLLPNIKVWWTDICPDAFRHTPVLMMNFKLTRFWPEMTHIGSNKVEKYKLHVGLIWKTFVTTLVWPSKGPNFAISTKNKRVLTWAARHLNRKMQLILIQLHNSSFCNVIMFYILDDKLVVRQPLVIRSFLS